MQVHVEGRASGGWGLWCVHLWGEAGAAAVCRLKQELGGTPRRGRGGGTAGAVVTGWWMQRQTLGVHERAPKGWRVEGNVGDCGDCLLPHWRVHAAQVHPLPSSCLLGCCAPLAGSSCSSSSLAGSFGWGAAPGSTVDVCTGWTRQPTLDTKRPLQLVVRQAKAGWCQHACFLLRQLVVGAPAPALPQPRHRRCTKASSLPSDASRGGGSDAVWSPHGLPGLLRRRMRMREAHARCSSRLEALHLLESASGSGHPAPRSSMP